MVNLRAGEVLDSWSVATGSPISLGNTAVKSVTSTPGIPGEESLDSDRSCL